MCQIFKNYWEICTVIPPHVFSPLKSSLNQSDLKITGENSHADRDLNTQDSNRYKGYISSLSPDSRYHFLKDRLLEEVHKTLASLLVQQTCASLQNVATCQLVIKLARALSIPTDPRQPVFQGLFLAGLWRKCTQVWAWFINGIKQFSKLTP